MRVSAWLVTQIAMTQLASFLALLLFASAVQKLMHRTRAERAVHELSRLPLRHAGIALSAAALAEVLAGGLLWLPAGRLAGAVFAALIWGCYFASMLLNVRAGFRDVDCGCSFGATHGRLGAFQLLRTLVLAALAAAIALSAVAAPGAVPYEVSAAAIATQILSAAALLALYGALDHVMALQPLRTGELR
jgi:hypothetical protein